MDQSSSPALSNANMEMEQRKQIFLYNLSDYFLELEMPLFCLVSVWVVSTFVPSSITEMGKKSFWYKCQICFQFHWRTGNGYAGELLNMLVMFLICPGSLNDLFVLTDSWKGKMSIFFPLWMWSSLTHFNMILIPKCFFLSLEIFLCLPLLSLVLGKLEIILS